MKILFLVFIVMPVVEMFVLIQVGAVIGAWYTIALVVLTAFIGANLLRQQGMSTLLRANQKMASGEIPASEVAEGFLIALGGAFLLTPGFITDSLGFSLLVPVLRKRLVQRLVNTLVNTSAFGTQSTSYQFHVHSTAFNSSARTAEPGGSPSGRVIDGEIVDRGPDTLGSSVAGGEDAREEKR